MIRKMKILFAALFINLGLSSMPVMAAEVTPADAYLWTNGTSSIQVDDTADAAIVEGPTIGKKFHITGVTRNSYWQVDFNGVPAYIPQSGLSDVVIHDGIITKYYDIPIVNDELATIIVNSTEYNTANGHFAINYTATNKTALNVEIDDEAFSAGYANDYDWNTASLKKSHVTTYERDHSINDTHNIVSVLAPNETKVQRMCYDTILEGGNASWTKNEKYEVCTKLFKLRFSVRESDKVGKYRYYNATKFYDFTTDGIRMEQETGLVSNHWK